MSDQANARGSGGGEGGGDRMDAWWVDRSVPQKILIVIGFVILGIGLFILCGWVVMLLWNWLMPEIFGLKRLNYWQAWGLLALCTILFKGFPSGNSGKSDRKRKKQLRRYMREDQSPEGERPSDSSEAGGKQ